MLRHGLYDAFPDGGLVDPVGMEARLVQGGLDLAGGGFDAVFVVGEQVDILGGPGDDPVRQQGVPAAEGEPVLSGGVQGETLMPPRTARANGA